MITIRNYNQEDANALWNLFFNTIRNINIRDYPQKVIEAWAPHDFDMNQWQKRMDGIQPFIAEIDGVIVGYTDLQESGLVDHFFCHHQYQGKGVGSRLMNHVFSIGKARGVKRYYSEVSITARPFYEHMGFQVVNQQEVEIGGQKLKNFIMEKFS